MDAPKRVSDDQLYMPYIKLADLKDIPFVMTGYSEREGEYKGKKKTECVFVVVPITGGNRGQLVQLTMDKTPGRARLGSMVTQASRGPFLVEKKKEGKDGKPLKSEFWAFTDAGEAAHKKAVALFERMDDDSATVVEDDDLPF